MQLKLHSEIETTIRQTSIPFEFQNLYRIKMSRDLSSSLYIYHFSTVVDFLSEKYSDSTGYRNSWDQ